MRADGDVLSFGKLFKFRFHLNLRGVVPSAFYVYLKSKDAAKFLRAGKPARRAGRPALKIPLFLIVKIADVLVKISMNHYADVGIGKF